MTANDILAMTPDEIDQLVASRLMSDEANCYSLDIGCAMHVVKRLEPSPTHGYWLTIHRGECIGTPNLWNVLISLMRNGRLTLFPAYADTLPLAICRAALLTTLEARQ